MTQIRTGKHQDFAPPVEEGLVFEFEDESGDVVSLEFLGMILHNDSRYGFFFPIDEAKQVGDSGEVLILEVTATDSNGQPESFSAIESDNLAQEVYEHFKQATKDIYQFE